MEPLIRPAVPSDAAGIARLDAALGELRATPEHIADHIAHRAQFEAPFVAEIDGEIVGLCCLRLLANLCDPVPYAELTELRVHPAHQRQGIGRALVRRVEREARERGAVEVVLMTAWRNCRAHAFYHALGYTLYTVMMRRPLADTEGPTQTQSK